jgi:Flp pilus assembly protein CpaB
LKRSNRLILLIGFLLAAVAFVGVVLLLGNGGGGGGGGGGGENVPDATKSTIVVTSVDVPLGTTITSDLVTTQDVKITEKPVGAYTLTSEVIGRTVTTQLIKGQLIDANAFSTSTVNPDIARLLDPGKRAIAVQVDQVSGVGTLVKPGDRVDVVLALTEEQTSKNPITTEGAPTREGQPLVTVRNFTTIDALLSNTTVKVLVENIRVVGTLLPPPPAQEGGNQGNQGATTGNAAPSLNGQSQITLLEVTPQQAELIRFTQLDGNLSLVLRAPGDAEAAPVKTTGITVRELVDKYGVLPPKIILTEQP